jgi:hypothetical protein
MGDPCHLRFEACEIPLVTNFHFLKNLLYIEKAFVRLSVGPPHGRKSKC